MIKEFREFISRGNVMDLAVAVIIGAAFTAIVTSLVDDIIMPIVGVLLGGIDFTSLAIQVGHNYVRQLYPGDHQLPDHCAGHLPDGQGHQLGIETGDWA